MSTKNEKSRRERKPADLQSRASAASRGASRLAPQLAPVAFGAPATADEVRGTVSDLRALDRLAERNPDIVMAIIKSSDISAQYGMRRHSTAAIVAGLVCLAIIGCSTRVVLEAGFWAGIVFFMALVVVLAVVTVVFTGVPQDVSWLVGLIPGKDKLPDDTS